MMARTFLESFWPVKASIGKEYSEVVVDGTSYQDMTLIGQTTSEAEFLDKYEKHFKFNYLEQKIELKP